MANPDAYRYRATVSMPLYNSRPTITSTYDRFRLLCRGSFRIIYDTRTILQAPVTSGQPAAQFINNYWEDSLSPAPASNAIVGAYRLSTGRRATDSGLVPAMGVWHYKVMPLTVYPASGSGRPRTGITLHYDNNYSEAPGSGGCLSILPLTQADVIAGLDDWGDVMSVLDGLYGAGIPELPVSVSYWAISLPRAMERRTLEQRLATTTEPTEQHV